MSSDDEDDGMDADGECELKGLNKWNPVKIGLTNTLGIFAPRGSGKSFCIRDLLYKNQHRFKAVVIICPTEKVNKAYGSIIPDLFIYDELNQETLDAIVRFYDRQKELSENLPPWMETDEDRSLLIIMDDCMASEKKYLNSLSIKDLYKNGRHYKFALWVVVQYFNDLTPDVRNNLDISIVLKVPNLSMQKKFFEFFGGFKDKNQFADVLKTYTDKYGALVKDTTTGSTDVEKMFFWYKADKTPDDFKMNPDQWAFHDYHYIRKETRQKKRDWNKFAEDPAAEMNARKGDAKKKQFKVLLKYDENGLPMDP